MLNAPPIVNFFHFPQLRQMGRQICGRGDAKSPGLGLLGSWRFLVFYAIDSVTPNSLHIR
jgi:hypothetical protein